MTRNLYTQDFKRYMYLTSLGICAVFSLDTLKRNKMTNPLNNPKNAKKHTIVSEYADAYSKLSDSQEGVRNGCLRIFGVVAKVDVENDNGRIYERSHYQLHVDNMNHRIETEGVFGEYRHPKELRVNWDRMTHMVEKVWIDESGLVYASFILLNTPYGRLAQEIALQGGKIRPSSRGTGTIADNGVVNLNEMYTFDLVDIAGFESVVDMRMSGFIKKTVSESMTTHVFEETEVSESTASVDEINETFKQTTKTDNDFWMSHDDMKSYIQTVFESAREVKNKDKDKMNEEDFKVMVESIRESFESRLQTLENNIQERIHEAKDEAKREALQTMEDALNEQFEDKELLTLDQVGEFFNESLKPKFMRDLDQWIDEDKIKPVVTGLQRWIDEDRLDPLTQEMETWVMETAIDPVIDGVQQYIEANNEVVEKGIELWVREDFKGEERNWTAKTLLPAALEKIDEELKEAKTPVTGLEQIDAAITEALEANKKAPVTPKKTVDEHISIKFMPESIKPMYEALEPERKEELMESAKAFNLENEGDVIDFWNSRDLRQIVESRATKLSPNEAYMQNLRRLAGL